MSSVNRSLYESRWASGYAQLFSYYIEVPGQTVVEYVLDIGQKMDYAIRAFIIEASGPEIIGWQSFAGTQYTSGTGTEISASPRNSRENKGTETKLIISPAIIDDGTPLVSPARELFAQAFAGNRNYLRRPLLGAGFETELLLLEKNNNYMVRINNSENQIAKIDVIIEGWNQ